MTSLLNSGIDSAIKQFSGQVSSGVLSAIKNASASTGVDFTYLLQQAKAESSFNPNAKSKSSSAGGLYQFIKSTWLDMVNRHGDKYGIDTGGMSKSQILDLRYDADIAANMAAEFAAENKQYLERTWGGDVGSTELYFAHFLGAGGAASFLKAKDESPLRIAADVFPRAANANRNVFYDSATGKPRTLSEVYDFFDKKFSTPPSLPTHESRIDMKVPPRNTPTRPSAAASTYNDTFYNTGAQSVVRTRRSASPLPLYNLVRSPVELMIMAEMDTPYDALKSRADDKENNGGIRSSILRSKSFPSS